MLCAEFVAGQLESCIHSGEIGALIGELILGSIDASEKLNKIVRIIFITLLIIR